MSDWTVYGIWGLLFYDDQPAWFTLVECMQILFHRNQKNEGRLFEPPTLDQDGVWQHEVVVYDAPLNWNLRHLLFRDLEMGKLVANKSPDPGQQWRSLTDKTSKEFELNLSYLPNSFRDVESLQRALELLRSTEVDAYSSKRWTSRHLLPLGPDMLFADVREQSRASDRRFMRRNGELLYLMLGRSEDKRRDRLTELLKCRLLDRDPPWNQLARIIGTPQGQSSPVSTGYLPFRRLSIYDQLAEDWVKLLSLEQIQVEDLLDPLMRLSALHQVIYILFRAQSTLGLDAGGYQPFVLDLAGSARKNSVQKLSVGQYSNHFKLPRRAIDAYIDSFAESTYWKEAISSTAMATDRAARVLQEMFLWRHRSSDVAPSGPPNEMLEQFRSDLVANTKHAIWSVIGSHGRSSGMVLAQPGSGTWYAPNDAFLEALVLANVERPVELGEFLRRLFTRYRIVIGQEQAQNAFSTEAMISLEKLKNNEHRLEERLRILGFIDRKSDACAFVVNPFFS